MRRSVVWLLSILALVIVVAAGLWIAVFLRGSSQSAAECTVPAPEGVTVTVDPGMPAAGHRTQATSVTSAPTVEMTAVQLQHASTINAVGLSRALPERARIIAVATAWQESKLRNLAGGDRDSVGLFQQRPSQGWGDPAQLQDPVYAAGKFYDALEKVDGWEAMSLTAAAQAVQNSAYPDAYAQWEPQATAVVMDLSGDVPVEVACRGGAQAPSSIAASRATVSGVPAASDGLSSLLAAAQAELGPLTLRQVATGSATVSVSLPDRTFDQSGQALAGWLVSHAAGAGITEVDVADRSYRDHAWAAATGATLDAGDVTVTLG